MKATPSHTSDTITALRTGIQRTYARYHARDRDRFPLIEYNTNRANYEPLRASFDHELIDVQGIDPANPAMHIPSANTLALLFTDDSYVPGPKILTACRWYADSSATRVSASSIATGLTRARWVKASPWRWLGVLLLVGVLVGLLLYRLIWSDKTQGELTIQYPKPGQVVPRLLPVRGTVINADTVWLIVRPDNTEEYYVQLPAPVAADGTWRRTVTIGMQNTRTAGYSFDIRAFVSPQYPYRLIDTLADCLVTSWPENARFSTKAIRVVRGNDGNDSQ